MHNKKLLYSVCVLCTVGALILDLLMVFGIVGLFQGFTMTRAVIFIPIALLLIAYWGNQLRKAFKEPDDYMGQP